jgi:hypothetical protein
LTRAQKKRVKAALRFSRRVENVPRMSYNAIVIDAALRENYNISVGDYALIIIWAAEYQSQKIFFKINEVRLFKLICSEYLQSKSDSPRLLGPVDFG